MKENSEIKDFVRSKFNLIRDGFNLFQKSDVNGPHSNPVFAWLKSNTSEKDIHWNFGTVFLVHRSGQSVERFDKKGAKALSSHIDVLVGNRSQL